MRRKIVIILALLMMALAGLWLFKSEQTRLTPLPTTPAGTVASAQIPSAKGSNAVSSANTATAAAKRFPYRLTNTGKTLGELTHDTHAVLLENAFIDTAAPLTLALPSTLKMAGDPGAYIVQAKGTISGAFRQELAAAGARVVSYIPNNAYLVRLNSGGARALQGSVLVQSVLPYEPYYKISSSAKLSAVPGTAAFSPRTHASTNTTTLLALAVAQKPLPAGTYLTLGLFEDTASATVAQIKQLGGKILTQDPSPFGEVVRVQPPADWIALVNLTGVQRVEPAYRRQRANDLSRPTLGLTTDSVTTTNYMGLTGKNVLVEVNDTGIDPTHPDLAGRVFGDFAGSLYDTDGHGTFVAGEIAGDGTKSTTVTNASGSINPGTNSQYRGKAPLATLYSVGGVSNENGEGGHDTNAPISDSYFQEQPALTNALISNNSWVNAGDTAYDLSAASYDAAVRDALPRVTGSQPVQFVFAAGNDGGGDDNGDGGNPDSINSPGTAKNVITVGALEQLRNITNLVTEPNNDGTTNTTTSAVWSGLTDSAYEVASYSSRGNVGIGTEGTYGRVKPDVVTPGTFVVSTRSQTWDTNVYYNPTNYNYVSYSGQTVASNEVNNYAGIFVPNTAVQLSIYTAPSLPLYLSLNGFASPGSYDITSSSGSILVPPDSGGDVTGIGAMQGRNFSIAVGNNTSNSANFNLIMLTAATNNLGNYFQQLNSLNDGLGSFYRYESGTSMAAAEVSGILALMQDFFTNTLSTRPSPALLKALLINGARLSDSGYAYQVQAAINLQGWGLVNLPNSLPLSLTNSAMAATPTLFYLDQSVSNALATGDTRTYNVQLPAGAQSQSLRVTLAWTDPPGNPAAAIKLVNNLALVVTNMDNPANPQVFYGNDITANQLYNTPEGTNGVALDNINNVQNVYLAPGSGTNFTVTVIGAAVNVNAVTAQTNDVTGVYAPNIVQDFALVVSLGDGFNTNGFAVTLGAPFTNPTNDLRITDIGTTNSPLLNQFVGASSPLLGTNQLSFSTNSVYGNGAVVTIGQTNQWHFYVVTNNAIGQDGTSAHVTNAAFVIFLPNTAAIPREGVYAGSDANSTRPEADVDLFVTTDPNLLSLSPLTISNCINGWQQTGHSVGGVFNGSSLGRGGSEYVVDTNAHPGQVYYIGVQSEDQMASEYGFLAEFSDIPFSQLDANGNETVQFFPVNIADGNPVHTSVTNTFGIAIYPIKIQRVIMTNTLAVQNGGDYRVVLSHASSVVLEDYGYQSPNAPGIYNYVYDDSGQNDIPGSIPTSGPGSLRDYITHEGSGIWNLAASDNAGGLIGSTSGQMFIQKHSDLRQFETVTLQPHTWFYGYIEVPVGYTNLTLVATNVSVENGTGPLATPPLEMFEQEGTQPTLTTFAQMAGLTNSYIPGLPYPTGPDPGNALLVGPPLVPDVYYLGIYNPSSVPQTVLVGAYLYFDVNAITSVNDTSTGTTPLIDDAVQNSAIFVTNRDIIQDISIGLRVDHSRISDLAFTLISPDGSRYLLMENRGGTSTNGAGSSVIVTNMPINSNFEGVAGDYLMGATVNGWTVTTNQVSVVTDSTNAYEGSNFLALANGTLSANVPTTVGQTYTFTYAYRGPGAAGWWRGESNVVEVINTNASYLSNGVSFITGKVGLAFHFDGVDDYALIPANSSLNVGNAAGITVDCWIKPTDVATQRPLVVWARNAPSTTNISVTLGPLINSNNGHYYYVLPARVWGAQEAVANLMGGHLATIRNANENTWIYNNITASAPVRNAYIGLNAPNSAGSWTWISGEPVTYGPNWAPGEPNFIGGAPFAVNLYEMTSPYPKFWNDTQQADVLEGIAETTSGVDFWQSVAGTGSLYANLLDTTNGSHIIYSAAGILQASQYQHVALTYDRKSGIAKLYRNGIVVANTNLGVFIPKTSGNVMLGKPFANITGTSIYSGDMDEVGIYQRALSPSEIKAIYTDGALGKFDTNKFSVSPAQSLAEVNVVVDGITNITFGNNTTWQTNAIAFIASNATTAIAIKGVEPGMLLDAASLVSVVTNNVYLTFTEDTNLTTTPIKFAPVPFLPASVNTTININNGWIQWPSSVGGNDHWYQPVVNSNVLTWAQIDTIAQNEGGYLATITSQAENDFVFNLVNNPKYFNGIGGNGSGPALGGLQLSGSPEPAGGWTWETGEPWSYTSWRPGQPDNGGGFGAEDRLQYWSGAQGVPSKNWNDLNSNDSNLGGYVVEHDALPLPPSLAYLPEQSLEPLIGTSAYGLWQMEIWDSRTGATNNAYLDSWQLQFTFANTNDGITLPPNDNVNGVLTNRVEATNTVPVGGGLNWYRVPVPLNADIATNRLIFADLPLNVWFSTNVPPTTNGLGDTVLIPNQTNGTYILFTNGSPFMVPGGTYYLGLQNTNSVAVNYGVEVDFHLITNAPYAFTMAATKVTGTSAQLNGMATPNGFPGTAWFQWGVNTNYGGLTTPLNVGVGTNVVYVTGQIGMIPNLPFHCRLVVSNVSAVTYGFDQILDEANVAVWGADYLGQANVPLNLSNVVAIAGAYQHSLALKNDGTPVAWGDNGFGQSTVPTNLNNAVVAIAGGDYYSLVLKTNGTVYSWGANVLGQTNVPTGLSNVVAIAGGTLSSLALKTNGVIAAWGANLFGLTNIPAGLSNVVALAGGNYHNVALKNDGTVKVWGDNGSGQTNVPPDLTNVVAIAAGSLHTLALKDDGTVVAWGDNSSGQTNVPVGLSNVVAVAAGGFNSTVLLADGTILAWGDDSAGQTVPPFGLTNVVAISSGYLHSMALTPQNIYFTNITHAVLIGGVGQTNNIFPNGIVYYQVNVPTNADAATNSIWFTQNGPLDMWFTTNVPPTLGSTNDTLLLSATTGGASVLNAGTSPLLVPGGTYYLAVHNTNQVIVNYGIEVDFHVPGTNALTLPVQADIVVGAGVLMTVTNTATDANTNAVLTYILQITPTNSAVIDTNGIITWIPPLSATNQSFAFTTVVTDDSVPANQATNSFNVLVVPVPMFSSAVMGTNGISLQWSAPTNQQFQVQYATNLVAPINWILIPGIITSTNGTFNFTDTNAPLVMKFYELLLLP